MKALILQHTKDSPPGTTEEWLCKKNISYSIVKFFEPDYSFPRADSFDMLIICGGGMNIDEEGKYEWMRPEKEFISTALKQNKIVVGLCLGGQLMAEALGAKVQKHSTWEVGWWPVRLTPIRDLPPRASIMAFQFHGYSFETPSQAISFASSEPCHHQAFWYGKSAVGFQFHPETTPEWVVECSEEKLPEGPFVQSPQQMLAGNQYQPDLKKFYFEVLETLLLSHS